jgi:DNA-directed RNA polymerase subunit M/transcription elongation factor TFIIS
MEKDDFKVTDNRAFGDGTLNDLPEEEIPVPDEKKPLSVKLKEEKERKVNKKLRRQEKKSKSEMAKEEAANRIMTCPLCKYKDDGLKFLQNMTKTKSKPIYNYTVCPKCGILFMPPGRVKDILKLIDYQNKTGIIVPGK